jgi:hypothetical protein
MSDINVIVNDEIVNIDIVDEPVLVNVINSPGVPGAPGVGVPVGGTTGQVLAKNSATNYDTEWVDVSGGVWGTITGTLSNQTDLQNALNAKFDDPTGTTSQYLRGDGSLATFPSLTGFVPYTGATANVDLGTHRILAQNATIASSGSGDTVTLNHSSGSGNGLTITKGGNGEGLYINKTSGSGNAATIIGTINATTFVKSGGTSAQFLKADGTVDSSVYVPTSTTLTINGVSYDLSANRSWTVSGGISGSGASGQVAYWNGTSSQSGSNNLFWDNTNGRLGIGTNAPATILDAKGNRATVSITDTTANGSNPTFFGAFADFLQLSVNRNPSTGVYAQNTKASSQISLEGSGGSGSIRFYATNSNGVSPNELMRIYGTGNLLIQNGGTFTDSGQRLQVQGTTLLNGNVTFSSSTGMTWDATNSRLGIGTNAPRQSLHISKTTGASIYLEDSDFTSTHNITEFSNSNGTFQLNTRSSTGTFVSTDYQLSKTATTTVHSWLKGDSSVSMRLFNTGNLLLQSGGTFTDSGERLQVTGTMKVTGAFFAGSGTPTSIYLRNATISGTTGDIGLGVFNSSTTGTTGVTFGESNNIYGGFAKWGSSYGSNYPASSIPLANSFQIQSGTTNNLPLVIQGTPIILTVGNTGTNYAARLSAGSFRITTLSNAHTNGTALLDIDASTTSAASFRIRSGTAPTTPNDGDIWYDGTNIYLRVGATTKTFVLL